MRTKEQLRQLMRAKRRELTTSQQNLAARRIANLLRAKPPFSRSKRVAFYLAYDGEIDPCQLLRLAAKQNKQCFLPVVTNSNKLLFTRYKPGDKLITNRFNILQPIAKGGLCSAKRLDLVLVPLVAYDIQGARLGMGGGYYDRSFAFKKMQSFWQKPILLGLAHHCQLVEGMPVESWDIPLHMIVTDEKLWRTR